MTRFSLSGKKLTILLHIVTWIVLFFLPTYLFYDSSPRAGTFILQLWYQLACYATIFYTSYFIFAPRYFFTGKKMLFFTLAGFQIILFLLVFRYLEGQFNPMFRHGPETHQGPTAEIQMEHGSSPLPGLQEERKPPPPVKNMPLFNFLLTSCLVTGLSLGLRFSEKVSLNEKLRKEAEKEKLHTELTFLKHQINPHFLFNTLNSIYSLALMNSDRTAEAVMKLSDMMRYVLQDVEKEKVPLELELEYLQHYVELQKIRLSDKVDVQFCVEGDPKSHEIPPVILVPFVENAFKYGTSAHDQALIRIDVRLIGGILKFMVSNQIFTARLQPETFGIGIRNTRQRLQLIYPGRHTLEIEKTDSHFIVNMTIDFS